MVRRHRLKWADDPFVTVWGYRLRMAIDFAGMNLNSVARTLGGRDQHAVWRFQRTLDRITRGQQRSCRRSLLRKVAPLLGVTERWLCGGDPEELPPAVRVAAKLEELKVYLRIFRLPDAAYRDIERHLHRGLQVWFQHPVVLTALAARPSRAFGAAGNRAKKSTLGATRTRSKAAGVSENRANGRSSFPKRSDATSNP